MPIIQRLYCWPTAVSVPAAGYEKDMRDITCNAMFHSDMLLILQAQSARLIGEAVQQNPAFLILRRIEVS